MAGHTETFKVSFELSDGRVLLCEYDVHTTYGNCSGAYEDSYPDESDVDDPVYYLDGDEVELNQLPHGLDVIAERMYDEDCEGKPNFRVERKYN